MGDAPWYDVWQQTTLSVSAVVGLLGFLRALEHRKDSNFRAIAQDLSDPASPVLRASAAATLPSYALYRRFFLLHHPYRYTALKLVTSALKRAGEEKYVRQQLAYGLREILWAATPEERQCTDLMDAQLNELILHHFRFDDCDLTGATLDKSDLGGASFKNAKLWKTTFRGSNCSNAVFAGAEVWDAGFEDANLRAACFDGVKTNTNTVFRNASLADANPPAEIRQLAKVQGAKNLF